MSTKTIEDVFHKFGPSGPTYNENVSDGEHVILLCISKPTDSNYVPGDILAGGIGFTSKFYSLICTRKEYEDYVSKMRNEPVQAGNLKYDKCIIGKYGSGSCTVDVYSVLSAFEVTNPQLQHLTKKALNVGQRGHKDTRQDLVDILHSSQSALDAYNAKELYNEFKEKDDVNS